MPSYVVVGASRGLGYAFIKHLSQDPSNIVIGLVRSEADTEKKVAEDGLKNVHILQADMVDAPALRKAAEETAKITGGGLDVLINNAAYMSQLSGFATLSLAEANLEATAEDFRHSFDVNVLGPLNTTTAFLPQIRAGKTKKVIFLTTGMADIPLINEYGVAAAPPYTVSKAALNALVAKYNAAFGKSEGILFLGVSPGVVNTSLAGLQLSPDEQRVQAGMFAQFAAYAPDFKGPISAAESVDAVLKVVDGASVQGGWGGKAVSHFGTERWL